MSHSRARGEGDAWPRELANRRVLNRRHVSRRQIEEELAALQKDRTEKVKHLFERQDREMNTFDSESRCLGFGSLGSLDFPKEDNR